MRVIVVLVLAAAVAALAAVLLHRPAAAAPRPAQVVSGQVRPCPQAPEPLCANGTNCCG